MTELGMNGVVEITNREIYNELVKVKEVVVSMSNQAGQIADHETRIRAVEKWKYTLPASISSSVIAIIVALLEAHRG